MYDPDDDLSLNPLSYRTFAQDLFSYSMRYRFAERREGNHFLVNCLKVDKNLKIVK